MGIYSEFVAETEEVYIKGDGRFDLDLVGGSDYQKRLKRLSRSHSKRGTDRELIAKLHYENSKSHDANAIRVVIDGGTVGYLSPKDASLFRRRIEKFGMEGIVVSCNALILGGKRISWFKKSNYRVCLDLPIGRL